MKTKKLIGLIGSIILLIGVSSFLIIRIVENKSGFLGHHRVHIEKETGDTNTHSEDVALAKFEDDGYGDEDSHAVKITLSHLEGEWLNKNYIEKLHSTKSPREAVTGNSFVHMKISKENDSYKLLLIWNFHEGITYDILELLPISAPNTYQLIYQTVYIRPAIRPDSIKRNLVIRFENSVKEIVWPSLTVFGTSKGPVAFLKIEQNVDEYVNRIVLAGNYIDERGRAFVFSESGEAQWPDETFKYKVGLDYIFPKHDYFYIPDKKDEHKRSKTYIFLWENGKLLIFDTYFIEEMFPDGFFFEKEEEPLHVLTPH